MKSRTVTPLGLDKKLTPNILESKIRHENDDILKTLLSKKGVEKIYLSNGINKAYKIFVRLSL
jgi:hypothetical protein